MERTPTRKIEFAMRSLACLALIVLGGCATTGPTDPQPFIDAVKAADLKAVTAYVGSGADPNAPNGRGETPFVAAINQFHVPKTAVSPSFAIETDWPPDAAAEATERRQQRDRRMIAILLVRHGGDPKATCINGHRPLMVALANGQPEIAEELILRGADVNDVFQEYPGEERTALHLAIEWPDITGLLLSKGAKVDARDDSGRTALHKAAVNGYAATVNRLIHAGADVNASTTRGVTALEWVKEQASEARFGVERYGEVLRILEAAAAKKAASDARPK